MAADERYDKLKTKTLPSGKTVYSFSLLKSITPNTLTDTQVLAGDADRMDVMAHNAYGDASSWWKIAAANKIRNGSLSVNPGTILYISTT